MVPEWRTPKSKETENEFAKESERERMDLEVPAYERWSVSRCVLRAESQSQLTTLCESRSRHSRTRSSHRCCSVDERVCTVSLKRRISIKWNAGVMCVECALMTRNHSVCMEMTMAIRTRTMKMRTLKQGHRGQLYMYIYVILSIYIFRNGCLTKLVAAQPITSQ